LWTGNYFVFEVKPNLIIFEKYDIDCYAQSTPLIDHSAWNGVRLADFVMPSFDFIVGVSLAMSMQGGRLQHKSKQEKLYTALMRAAKLFLIGILTQAGTNFPTYDLKHLRIMGILQRVALCYLVAAVTEVYAPLESLHDLPPSKSTWKTHAGDLLQCTLSPLHPDVASLLQMFSTIVDGNGWYLQCWSLSMLPSSIT
jgi:hypothetical protein